jgi:hypothetical protein
MAFSEAILKRQAFILFRQSIKVYRCLLMDATLKNPCTLSLFNLNTTYHFLGRRQTACYVNYSKLAVQIHAPSFLLFLIC